MSKQKNGAIKVVGAYFNGPFGSSSDTVMASLLEGGPIVFVLIDGSTKVATGTEINLAQARRLRDFLNGMDLGDEEEAKS